MNKNIKEILGIKYPIIQGGMVWVSGAKLAAAVSNAGGLGLIGAGSMTPELLKKHIIKAQTLTKKPFGINIPLLYKYAQEHIEIALDLGVKIFFTSAGSPKKYTKYLQQRGAIVAHVTSSPFLAKKCQDAGVDIIVAEGFEAGGHNGREEITTMALIPQVVKEVHTPIIAAGGIADGKGIFAAIALGASGIQMGTRFMMTKESSAHSTYKELLVNSNYSSTEVRMKKSVPVRLVKNLFFNEIVKLEDKSATKEELLDFLGKGRARKGMLEGDLNEGELEAGEICGLIDDLPLVKDLMIELIKEYEETRKRMLNTHFL